MDRDPQACEDAVSGPKAVQWKGAHDGELVSLEKLQRRHGGGGGGAEKQTTTSRDAEQTR